jgi:hypothetical protein
VCGRVVCKTRLACLSASLRCFTTLCSARLMMRRRETRLSLLRERRGLCSRSSEDHQRIHHHAPLIKKSTHMTSARCAADAFARLWIGLVVSRRTHAHTRTHTILRQPPVCESSGRKPGDMAESGSITSEGEERSDSGWYTHCPASRRTSWGVRRKVTTSAALLPTQISSSSLPSPSLQSHHVPDASLPGLSSASRQRGAP